MLETCGKKVRIYYYRPFEDQHPTRGDWVRVTKGYIENVTSNSIYIRNEKACLEIFNFYDIRQMVQIKE